VLGKKQAKTLTKDYILPLSRAVEEEEEEGDEEN
jgi:hypothetical protein